MNRTVKRASGLSLVSAGLFFVVLSFYSPWFVANPDYTLFGLYQANFPDSVLNQLPSQNLSMPLMKALTSLTLILAPLVLLSCVFTPKEKQTLVLAGVLGLLASFSWILAGEMFSTLLPLAQFEGAGLFMMITGSLILMVSYVFVRK